MIFPYFMVFLAASALAQTTNDVQVLPNPQTYEDFEHQNKGCPENSECDQVMGLQLTRWKDLVKKLKDPKILPPQRVRELEAFRAKSGIPADFYTVKKSQQGLRPLYFNSHCKEHNPKVEDARILVGTAFLKGIGKDKAMAWRDQAQMEVPVGELLLPQPVTVYYPEGPRTYQLPLGDQPLFVRGKNLHVVREDDEFFYTLSVSPEGEWRIVDLDLTKLSDWEQHRENTACPLDKTKPEPGPFGVEFCKTVLDEDSKKTVVAKMRQGCAT